MSELLDQLVEGERETMKPPAGAKKRTWKKVAGTVALGGPLPVEPSAIAGPVTAAKATVPWLKIVLGVVLGGAVAAGGYRLVGGGASSGEGATAGAGVARDGAEPEAPREPTPRGRGASTAPPQAEATMPAPGVAAPAPERSVAVPPDDDTSMPKAPAPHASRPRAMPAAEDEVPATADPATQAAPTGSALAQETRLLARARAKLRAGDPEAALSPLAEHARRFPDGQLAEDRMVLRAQAQCESGDLAGGRAQAAALRSAFPSSKHLARVARACDQP